MPQRLPGSWYHTQTIPVLVSMVQCRACPSVCPSSSTASQHAAHGRMHPPPLSQWPFVRRSPRPVHLFYRIRPTTAIAYRYTIVQGLKQGVTRYRYNVWNTVLLPLHHVPYKQQGVVRVLCVSPRSRPAPPCVFEQYTRNNGRVV